MGITSNYPHGFSYGVTIRGMPILNNYSGSIWWVDNTDPGASDGNSGAYQQPLRTIAGALAQAAANDGDTIMVKPGHAETISNATTLVLNKAGVSIIGLGRGATRPTLTFGTANTANIPVTAANVSIQNFLFIANFLNIASVFTATGTATPTDFTVDSCEFRDKSAVLNFVAIVKGNATANSMDGFTFSNNRVCGLASSPAANTTACVMAAASDRQTYANNFIVHAVALNDTAVLAAFGANDTTNLDMCGNRVFRPSTSTTGHLLSSSSTASSGYVYDNYAWHLDATAALIAPTGTKLGFQNNFSMITGAADKSGLINPAAV